MKVTIISIVTDAFGTATTGLLKGLEDLEVGGRVKTIQTTAFIENGQNTEKSPGDLKETCCHSNSSERPPTKTDLKNSNE